MNHADHVQWWESTKMAEGFKQVFFNKVWQDYFGWTMQATFTDGQYCCRHNWNGYGFRRKTFRSDRTLFANEPCMPGYRWSVILLLTQRRHFLPQFASERLVLFYELCMPCSEMSQTCQFVNAMYNTSSDQLKAQKTTFDANISAPRAVSGQCHLGHILGGYNRTRPQLEPPCQEHLL